MHLVLGYREGISSDRLGQGVFVCVCVCVCVRVCVCVLNHLQAS